LQAVAPVWIAEALAADLATRYLGESRIRLTPARA
jgi:hypothetical protein